MPESLTLCGRLSARQLPQDWESHYGYRPLLLETLVDAARFRGTCYRAANWIHVGQTAGRGRMDREHTAHGQAVKDIYIYPACTGGQLACPPEDCGAIGGFYDLLDALGDPTHEQHEELLGWVGDGYDPDAFSIDDVSRMLAPRRGYRGKTRSPAR